MAPSERDRAHEHLRAAGPPMDGLVDAYGPVDPYDWGAHEVAHGLLGGLVLHIVGQQISVAVTLVLYGRLEVALGGAISADALARQTEDGLRAVGLSRAKARAVIELGQRIVAGEVDLDGLAALDDAAALERLVALRGIGPWSAQMFLLHELRRPDVFPAGDVGLRDALTRIEGRDSLVGIDEIARRAEAWAPFRSYAAALLWTWRASNASSRRLASTPPA